MSYLSSIPLYMRNNHGITQYKKLTCLSENPPHPRWKSAWQLTTSPLRYLDPRIKFLAEYYKTLGISARTAKTSLKSRVTSFQQHPYTWCKIPRQVHSYQVCKILGHIAVFKVHSINAINLKIIFVCLAFFVAELCVDPKKKSINQNTGFQNCFSWNLFNSIHYYFIRTNTGQWATKKRS